MEGLFPHFVHVSVSFRPRRKPDATLELPAGATVAGALRAAGEPADHTVVLRAGTVVADSETLRDGDALLFLSAFSGG